MISRIRDLLIVSGIFLASSLVGVANDAAAATRIFDCGPFIAFGRKLYVGVEDVDGLTYQLVVTTMNGDRVNRRIFEGLGFDSPDRSRGRFTIDGARLLSLNGQPVSQPEAAFLSMGFRSPETIIAHFRLTSATQVLVESTQLTCVKR